MFADFSLFLLFTFRYQKLPHKSDSVVKNMKYLLNFCPNIKIKYCLALELNFKDIASELLMGEGSSYLQDLIANKLIKPIWIVWILHYSVKNVQFKCIIWAFI